LVPAFDRGDNRVWIGGPCEGPWGRVVLDEEAIDGGLQVDDASEHAALEAPFGELGEEALDGVEPGARGRCEVEREAFMAIEPAADVWMLMGGVVVEDDVDRLAGRRPRLDGVQEADELPRLRGGRL
jgi:hypothetical protein